MSTRHARVAGFTLIELMITVAIIGILAAVAYPSYTNYVVKSRRTDAQRLLVNHAQSLEKYFSANNSYVSSGTTCGVADPSPTTGYTVATSCASTGITFTITATVVPGGSQASDGDLQLSNDGAQVGKWQN